jgi:hypothetical protein
LIGNRFPDVAGFIFASCEESEPISSMELTKINPPYNIITIDPNGSHVDRYEWGLIDIPPQLTIVDTTV